MPLPQVTEISFRVKAIRRPDISCFLGVCWKGHKLLIYRCTDGVDLLAKAAHVLKAFENGVSPAAPPKPSEVSFRVRYSGDPTRPCQLVVYHDGVRSGQYTCADGAGALANAELCFTLLEHPEGVALTPALADLLARGGHRVPP